MILYLKCIDYKKANILFKLEYLLLVSTLIIDVIILLCLQNKIYYKFNLINIPLILIEFVISVCYHEFGHFVTARASGCYIKGILFEVKKQNFAKTIVLDNDAYRNNKNSILIAGIKNNFIILLISYMLYNLLNIVFFQYRFLELININIILVILNSIPIGESDGKKLVDNILKES